MTMQGTLSFFQKCLYFGHVLCDVKYNHIVSKFRSKAIVFFIV